MHIQAGKEFTHTHTHTHAHTRPHARSLTRTHTYMHTRTEIPVPCPTPCFARKRPPTLSFGVLSPRPSWVPVHCWLLRWACLTGVSLAIGAFSQIVPSPPAATRQICREGRSQSPRMLFTKLATSVSLESWWVKKGCCWVWKRFETSIWCQIMCSEKATFMYISKQKKCIK